MALSLITAPAIEPISIEEARQQVRRGDDTSEDSLLNAFIAAARLMRKRSPAANCSRRRGNCNSTRSAAAALQMPRPPLRSITSISYLDTGGATQTWARRIIR
jgi:hypothetical protein